MKLLEYEAKAILRSADIPVPRASIVRSAQDIVQTPVILKSQVPTGGRGKAGGIKLVENASDLPAVISTMLSLSINGSIPKVLLAEEKLTIEHEYYLSIIIDRQLAEIQLMAHVNGGVEVEENDPKSFLITTLNGKNTDGAGEKLADYYGLPSQCFILQDMIERLYRCFVQNDATLLEINPLVLTFNQKLVAADCKMELDDAARFRHPEWNFEAAPVNSSFVTLDSHGTVATIANGAGLAMATVDAVKAEGMQPANFLDIGGGANAKEIAQAFRQIMDLPNIRAIIINIFAGITRCDEVAKAIITAQKETMSLPPLFIRLAGTNFEEAVKLLAKENIPTLATLEECLVASKEKISE